MCVYAVSSITLGTKSYLFLIFLCTPQFLDL
uniref:Uncharacterized protein n=1 Tax=Anguilla anguilla TaxID=7936 RepID=A0A0E9UB76_ANGAN